MSIRNDIFCALHDAVLWQESIASSWNASDQEYAKAKERAMRYRKILERRYGDSKSAMDKIFEGAETINIRDII